VAEKEIAAYDGAVETLRRCCGPWGLKASGRRVGHHQIWARDSMIALLGARFLKDEEIQRALHKSITVLKDKQTAGGLIPNNIDCETQQPNFRAYADGGLWWIVGSTLVNPDPVNTLIVDRVLDWYDCQDVDQSGVLSMQEAADWQDLFCTRGKGLYLNCLYVLALRLAGREAEPVAARINKWFWYRGDNDMLRHIAHSFSTSSVQQFDSLGRRRWVPEKKYLRSERYYLPWLGFRAVGEWFDSLGNLLAIVAGVANEEQTDVILDFITRHGLDDRPMRSLTPAIRPGDTDWRDYYSALNAPDNYHNGGVWPFIGGFYVVALIQAGRFDAAAAALRKLADLNLQGEFNEWHHGETGEAMGVQDQAWSAGMYLFAFESVRRGRVEWS